MNPWVISADTGAEIAFVEAVFDARETPGSRMLGTDGRIGHVEVEVGDAVITMFDAGPGWPHIPSHLRVYVADTKNAVDRAAAADGGLDQLVHVSGSDGRHTSLRRLLCDLIEEYGRHTGHADLLREAVDGLVGEDPPAGWHAKAPDHA